MPKIYARGIPEFPRKRRRIAWYVEILCSELLKKDAITQEDIENFTNEANAKQERLPFPWQRENMKVETREGLSTLLSHYEYDAVKKVYKRKN